MGYREEMQFAAEADNEKFPDFIWNVQFNEEDTTYYEKAVNMNAWEEVQTLKRKYYDPFEFMHAMDVYNRYMDYLLDKYGSEFIIQSGAENGAIKEYVPQMPKLKPTKMNRQFMKCKNVPSQVIGKFERGAFKNLSNQMYGEKIKDGEELNALELYEPAPKAFRKLIKRGATEIAGLQRIENAYLTGARSEAYDFIIDTMNQFQNGRYSFDGNRENQSLLSIMKEMEQEELLDPDIEEYRLQNAQARYEHGRYVSNMETNQIEILKNFYKAGVDLLGTGAKGKDGKIVRLARKAVGYNEEGFMSKKERKKYKKQAKKEKKYLKRKDNDAMLEQTLFGNRLNFVDSDDSGTIHFSLADMYRKE